MASMLKSIDVIASQNDARIHQESKTHLLESKKIGSRIREIKGLTHDTFPYQIYSLSKDKCRELGKAGGKVYQEALCTLKFAKTGEINWDIAVHFFSR